MNDQYKILIPSEYESLRRAIPKTKHRIAVDCLLFTGMRYSELKWFARHLSTFDCANRAISLPGEAAKTGRGRAIHLTQAFTNELDDFVASKQPLEIPDISVMNRNLKRWGSWALPKTFRKTWESWLLAAGFPSMQVALSQGHTELISYGHYANLDPRLKSEMELIGKYTAGWGK
jgi:integrase